jgi:class 3 adenylate cyclase
MNKLLLLCFLLLSFTGYTQTSVTHLTKDSLSYDKLKKGWKLKQGDSLIYSVANYNDGGWSSVANTYYLSKDSLQKVVWLRLHFSIDSSLAGVSLALGIEQYGASEFYIDGKKVESFGEIGNTKTTSYYDPKGWPITIPALAAGEHILAVRYANFDARQREKIFVDAPTGFRVTIGKANDLVWDTIQSTSHPMGFLSLLFGIFFAISIVHLLLFLYYRQVRSNLFFSIFSFCLSALFFVKILSLIAHSPTWVLYTVFSAFFLAVAGCASLSAFINSVFPHKKQISKWLVYSIAALTLVLRAADHGFALTALVVLIIAACIETVTVIAIAIVKKVKGARIIGMGLLSFTGLILFSAILLIAGGGTVQITGWKGQLFGASALFAIFSIPFSMSAYLASRFASINKDLGTQLEQVQILSERTLQQEAEKKYMLESRKEELEKEVAQRTSEVLFQKEQIERQHEELKSEKKKSDDLLLNILPSEIADELKENGLSEARLYNNVTVLFTDFVNFTKAGERMSPRELVSELHACFKAFDEIIGKYGIEKIKTIGDAYLAVSGLPHPDERHAAHVISAAMEIREFISARKQQLGDQTFEIRIGIHSGPVVAGIVGVKKFAYDIWGDTVNTAARMEQSGVAGKINISATTYELIKDQYECAYRGEINAKNKGELKMYFVEEKKLLEVA